MPKVTRKRPISSCKYCYNHKIKCDRGSPCKNCIRLNNSVCEYNFQCFFPDPQNFREKVLPKYNSSIVTYSSNALFPHLGPMMRNVIVNSKNNKNATSIGFFNFARELNPSYMEMHLHKLIPCNEILEHHFNIYWECIHPLVPILDEITIISKLTHFANDSVDFNERQEIVEPRFLIIVFAVLFSVTIQLELIATEKKDLKELEDEKERYYVGYKRLLTILNFPRTPLIECVISSLIIYEVGTFCYRDIAFDVCIMNKTLCSMGIHLASNVHGDSAQQLAFKKQMIWHTAHKIETLSSIWCGSLPYSNFNIDIVSFPSNYEYDSNSDSFLDTMNPFSACQNLIFNIMPYFSDLMIFLNIDRSSNYYCSFNLIKFEENLFNLCSHFHEVESEIAKSNILKFKPRTTRWLIANSRNMLYRLYFLYYVCLEDKTVQSLYPLNPPTKEIDTIKNRLFSADKSLYTNFLKMHKSYDPKLVEIVMLLLYESRIRLTTEDDVTNFKWSIKNCNPFQYLVVLMKDIHNQPHKRYSFKDLNSNVQLLVERDMLAITDDLRIWLVSEVLRLLDFYKHYWPESSGVIYNFLVKVWNYMEESKQNTGVDDYSLNSLLDYSTMKETDMRLLSNIFDYLPLDFENAGIDDYHTFYDFPTDF